VFAARRTCAQHAAQIIAGCVNADLSQRAVAVAGCGVLRGGNAQEGVRRREFRGFSNFFSLFLNSAPPRATNQHRGTWGAIMNNLCGFATAAAVAMAASAFVTDASANPFGWFGLGYAPTDNGNQVRADLRRQTVNYPTSEAPGTVIVDTG